VFQHPQYSGIASGWCRIIGSLPFLGECNILELCFSTPNIPALLPDGAGVLEVYRF
jgi:hypothetical protein